MKRQIIKVNKSELEDMLLLTAGKPFLAFSLSSHWAKFIHLEDKLITSNVFLGCHCVYTIAKSPWLHQLIWSY